MRMLNFAEDEHMKQLEPLAEEFYDRILRPDEDPGFVSDEASVLDLSLAPEEQLIEKISAYYGKPVSRFDLRRPFWSFLTDLNAERTPGPKP